MACEIEQTAFQDAVKQTQEVLRNELAALASSAEQNVKELSDKFEADNSLAQGVGAAAGAAVGTAFGGPAGGAAGAVVGKAIGSLFTVEIREEVVSVKLDLPQVTVRDQEWTFDLPEITMDNQDIIFNVPTMVMRTVRGPDVPEIVVEMVTECVGGGWSKICIDVPKSTVRWKESYYDQPFWEDREQRIVIGKIVVGVPEFSMSTQQLSFTVPSVTIRFVKDAGKALAAAAEAIARDVETQTAQKQMALKERLKVQLMPAATPLFECHRSVLYTQREKVASFFNVQLDTIANTIITFNANGVPETDPNLISAKNQSMQLIAKRDEQLAQFDQALIQLEGAFKVAVEKMMG
jgi:outer membrane lipoprotein SlyB